MGIKFNPFLGNFDFTGGASSPLTTKGDLWGYSTVDARIPVGSDGQVLLADSTQALGVKWETVSGVGTDQFLPIYHIAASETVTIASRRQMAIHGGFINEGALIIEGSLVLE